METQKSVLVFDPCLHLGWASPGYAYKLGDERLESSPTERDLGFGLMAS